MLRFFAPKKSISLLLVLVMVMTSFAPCPAIVAFAEQTPEIVNLQILATSDLHGRFMPHEYATDSANTNGSLAQIASLVAAMKLANPNTIIVDNGDTIQDNSSGLFLEDAIHPMILAMNKIGYDTVTLGNHEFNYGVPKLEQIYSKSQAKMLAGNVYKPDGSRLGLPYTIVERSGVKIGIIGMTNPNITKWDAAHLSGYKVTSPIEETKKAVAELKGLVDVMIGVIHVGPTQEYGNDDGADVIAQACPELAAIVAGHAHLKLAKAIVNGVVITEPDRYGTNVSKIDIKLTKGSDGKYTIYDRTTDINSSLILVKDYNPDPTLSAELGPYHLPGILLLG